MLTCSSHVKSHVSARHMSYDVSQLRYQFTGRDIPTVPVHWPWHAPPKIKRGGYFCVLTGMWVFQPTPYTGQPTRQSHATKLGLRSTSSNAITALIWNESTSRSVVNQIGESFHGLEEERICENFQSLSEELPSRYCWFLVSRRSK